MDINSLLNNEKLKNIESDKLLLLIELLGNTPSDKNMSPSQMLPLLLNISKKASEKGISFTSGESDLIFEVLKNNMNESERHKADMVWTIMKNNKKN